MNPKHNKAYDPNFFEYVGSSVIFSEVYEIIQYETVTIDRKTPKKPVMRVAHTTE